jgi:hypothetical protein
MLLARIVAVLFGAGTLYNLVTRHWADAAVGLAIVLLLLALDFTTRRAKQQRLATLRWLFEHELQIRAGGARLGNVMVTPRTRFREMTLCVSVLLVTLRLPSRLLLEHRDSIFGAAFGFSLLTFLLGWWGLPWGPLYTIQALGRNLRGGKAVDVETLLAGERAGATQ